ncbi:hypothetical protein Q3G72_024470 [Acer saccharum]|nr:hypothetical protein Q3G72_024470 [Acer saccharum]
MQGNSFDDNTNDTAKNVFDLGAFVEDMTFEEDAERIELVESRQKEAMRKRSYRKSFASLLVVVVLGLSLL